MSGLGKFTFSDNAFFGIMLEGFCYGLYSAIFFMYTHHQASKELGIDKRNTILYALCILYVLCSAAIVMDTTGLLLSTTVNLGPHPTSPVLQSLHLFYAQITINALCDFISQAILVYRCWVVWNRNIRVIIIPSLLGLTFLATWLAGIGSVYIPAIDPDDPQLADWGYTTSITSFAISLTVNAVVTGLIVLRILKVSSEFGPIFGETLGVGGAEAKVRSIIFIMIESGMVLFAIQLIRIVLTVLELDAVNLIIGINQMFNGITPTIILLRVVTGLSYHDEKSLIETAASWRFAPQNQNPDSEIGGVEIVGQERPFQQCDDINIDE